METCEYTKTVNGKLSTWKNAKGLITYTSLHNDNGFTDTLYKEGKPLCSSEYNHLSGLSTYKNALGVTITEREFNSLRRSINLEER